MKYKPYTIDKVKKAGEQKLFTVISTFAGGGGSSTGYKLAGGEILCVNEFVDAALDTYFANYDGTPALTGDILNLDGYDSIIIFLGLTKHNRLYILTNNNFRLYVICYTNKLKE